MYGKLFTSMYDGTLATRGPWQALVTFQQMIVLADRDGIVDMTASAISRRTSIPLDIIDTGIAELMLPDPESRSPAEDGRRIVLLEEHRTWGWQIVNYAKYSAIRSAIDRKEYMRVAQAEHRAKKALSTTVNKQSTTVNTVNQPLALSTDVDVDVDVKKLLPAKKASDPDGFAEFWSAWPSTPRKQDRKKCAAKWRRSGFVSELPAILANIEAMKQSKQWCEGFEPAPMTYLNGERWADEVQFATNGDVGYV